MKTESDKIIEGYISSLGFDSEYERQHGSRNPDFSILEGNGKVFSVWEVEDLEMSKEELKQLKAGQVVTRSVNPYAAVREKINQARKQLAGAKEYPCVLVIARNGSHAFLEPNMIMAAMMGDITINIPINPQTGGGDQTKALTGFGSNGKMLRPGTNKSQNTTISAIAVLNFRYPDRERAGYEEKTKELLDKTDINDRASTVAYMEECTKLYRELAEEGYDLEKAEPWLCYAHNPFARIPLPKELCVGQFDKHYFYNLETGELKLTPMS